MNRLWKEGTIGIPVKGGKTKIAHYWAKVYDEGSEYGINEGIFFHVRIILLQPIVLKIEILTLIKNILSCRSERFPTHTSCLSCSLFHL